MKQIIVNVGGLSIEEKQSVNEALAKIQNVLKIEDVTTGMAWFYAPSYSGLQVGWNSILKSETPTHTPQQVIEMAGMEKKGHVHAELMAQYAEDAKTHAEPWKLWKFRGSNGDWHNLYGQPMWTNIIEYRRKPKTMPTLKVDAKVLVWMDGSKDKYHRHFSHFENDDIYVFDGGLSSWTGITTGNSAAAWDHFEVVE